MNRVLTISINRRSPLSQKCSKPRNAARCVPRHHIVRSQIAIAIVKEKHLNTWHGELSACCYKVHRSPFRKRLHGLCRMNLHLVHHAQTVAPWRIIGRRFPSHRERHLRWLLRHNMLFKFLHVTVIRRYLQGGCCQTQQFLSTVTKECEAILL